MPANAKSKYDALDRTAPAEPEPVELPRQERPARREAAPRLVGRPTTGGAKSKDPSMKPFTIILNIDAHADAILKKARNEGDLSDLMNRLLTGWLAEEKQPFPGACYDVGLSRWKTRASMMQAKQR